MRDHLDSLYPHPLQTTTDRHGNPTTLPAWSVLLPTPINPQHHVFPDLARLQRAFWKLTLRYHRPTHSLRLALPRRKGRLIPREKARAPMSAQHVLLWRMGEAYRWMAGWVAQVERTGVVVSLMESVGTQQMREIEERVRAARARPGLFGGGMVARREAEAVDDGVEMWEVEEEGGGYYESDADY
jgi:hypothetical protein